MKIQEHRRITTATLTTSILLIASLASSLMAQETKDSKPAIKTPTGKTNSTPTVEPAAPALSPDVEEIIKMTGAGVDAEILRNFVAQSKTPYALTANDIIALKEKKVQDEVTAAMLLRGQQINAPKQAVKPRIVQQLSAGGELDTESYEFFQNHYLYPRALSSSYKTLAPYAPQYTRGRNYGNSRFGGYKGQSRYNSFGPQRNDRRGGHYHGGGRFGR